jgi:hypothetical protein
VGEAARADCWDAGVWAHAAKTNVAGKSGKAKIRRSMEPSAEKPCKGYAAGTSENSGEDTYEGQVAAGMGDAMRRSSNDATHGMMRGNHGTAQA